MSTQEVGVRHSTAVWEGNLREGHGKVSLGSGVFSGPYSFDTRFGQGEGTTPEELIGAAHAACYAMATSAMLTVAHKPPTKLEATAKVHLSMIDQTPTITWIELHLVGKVEGMDKEEFAKVAEEAKSACLVTRALGGVEKVTLTVDFLA